MASKRLRSAQPVRRSGGGGMVLLSLTQSLLDYIASFMTINDIQVTLARTCSIRKLRINYLLLMRRDYPLPETPFLSGANYNNPPQVPTRAEGYPVPATAEACRVLEAEWHRLCFALYVSHDGTSQPSMYHIKPMVTEWNGRDTRLTSANRKCHGHLNRYRYDLVTHWYRRTNGKRVAIALFDDSTVFYGDILFA